jgi:tetratricopeptide (TPR) repeat protein
MYRICLVAFLGLTHLLGSGLGHAQETKALRLIIVRNKQEAQQIHQQLQQGASFSGLAGAKSIGPERRLWGYSGIVRINEVQVELRPVLQKLRPGEISEVLEVGKRFMIVKVISPEIERHFEAADRALKEKKFPQAIQALKAALALEQDNIQTYLKLGFAYDLAAQYEEAIATLEKAQRYAPQEPQITVMLGATHTRLAIEKKNRTHAQQAIQIYEQLLKLDQRFAPAVHFGLGKVYLVALQQPEVALSHLEQAVQITPRTPELYRLLIQAYYDTQRYQQALQHLRFARSLGYDFPDLREALAKVKK